MRVLVSQILKARIILSYKNEIEAKAVAKAVLPDNINSPCGLSITTKWNMNRMITCVTSADKNLKAFQTTIDDLLRYVSVAEKTLHKIGV